MVFEVPTAVTVAVTVFLAYSVIILIKRYINFKRNVNLLSKLPGPKPEFLFGNVRQFPGLDEEGLTYLRDQMVMRPKLSIGWLGPFTGTVQVLHPDTTKLILRTSEPKSKQLYGLIQPWLGDGLLISNGEKWARSRRLLTPAFHFDILKRYLEVKNKATDILVDKISSYADKQEYFEVFSHVCLFSLDVILQCAFSYKSNCQAEGNSHPYIQAVQDLSDLMSERFFQFWLHNDFLYHLTPKGRKWRKVCNYVHEVAEKIITERKETLDKEAKSGIETQCKDFLGILLTARDEDGVGMTPLEIRNEVDTFMFEGHDTTTSGTSWILYSIAKHPEIQRKVQQEIDDIMQGRESQDILWEDLSKLHYTTLVIKESLRINPPVTLIQRETTEPLTIEGHEIPEFIPERFLKENADERDPYSYVPFSAGPRNCIGQNFAMNEMKTAVAKLLRRFTFELDPNHKVERLMSTVLRSKTGIRMKAIPRKID